MSVGSNVAYASGWNGSPGCTVAFPSRSVRTSATLRVISISRSVGRGISTSTPSSSSTLARAARIPASLISWSGETVNRGIRRFGLGTVIEPSASWPPSRGKPRRQRYATRYRLQSGGRGRFLDESRSAFGLGYTEPRSLNTSIPRSAMSFVSHVECTICGDRHDPKRLLTVCARCGQMLVVRYDLERVKTSVSKDALRQRPPGMYRFRELTPLDDGEEPVTLGEGGTPLLPLSRLGAHLGLRRLFAKDEGQNPTGSFKARGLGMAITRARTLGARGFVIPSAGNAGGAAAVYAARAGLPCAVVVPRGTPPAAIAEAQIAGAHVFTVEGSIANAGKVVATIAPALGWFDLSTLKEPYRLEGKKTIGLELAAELGWRMPDVLLYPTGGGTGLVGIPKAYAELLAMGWLAGALPRCFAVQAEGCAPVVRAFLDGAETTTAWENPTTHAAGLRVPSHFAGRQMLRVLRETGGGAVAVSETTIQGAQRLVAQLEGIWTAPEAAALVAALAVLKERGDVARDTEVMMIFTGAGLKYEPPPLPAPTDLAGGDGEILAQVKRVIRP